MELNINGVRDFKSKASALREWELRLTNRERDFQKQFFDLVAKEIEIEFKAKLNERASGSDQ